MDVGAANPTLNRNHLHPTEILFPPLPTQKRIAHILGTLDDKIELNRRMNETLEEMARAIFKSWFVDFDPVIDNALRAGNPIPEEFEERAARRRALLDQTPYSTGSSPLPPNLGKLFPDSFRDSELGPIPVGWEVKAVGEVVDCVGGGTPSTKNPEFWEEGTYHWTTPKDFSSLQAPILTNTDRKITEIGLSKISSGLLPAGTLLMSSRAPVGYLAISAMPVAINQGFIAIKCNEGASNYFMLNWCQQNMSKIKGRATGTTFAEISKKSFRPIPLILPRPRSKRSNGFNILF